MATKYNQTFKVVSPPAGINMYAKYKMFHILPFVELLNLS